MTNWDSLSSHQKLSLGVFIVIGASAVVLWPFLVSRQINMPFKRTGDFSLTNADQVEQQRMDKLKTMDTDHDGLSDYDELYVYHTSPYLADTDSDGIPDGVEVAQNTDPNCPQGKVCRQVASAPTTSVANQQTGTATTDTSGGAGAGTNTSTDTTGATAGAAGAPPAPTDAQISAVITETFGDPTTLTPDIVKADIEKMSATDIRTFLGRLGVPEQALSKADDATLRKLVQDAMNSMTTQSSASASTGTATSGQSAAPTDTTNSGASPAAPGSGASLNVAQ